MEKKEGVLLSSVAPNTRITIGVETYMVSQIECGCEDGKCFITVAAQHTEFEKTLQLFVDTEKALLKDLYGGKGTSTPLNVLSSY